VISRTYIVKMPTATSTNPIDILVQTNPGSQAAPVVSGTDGAYYEWRGRPLVLPNPSGTPGFVPRFRLGFIVAVTPYSNAISPDVPGVQLSASLASVSSTDAGPTISVPAFADPAGGASIRLIGGAGTAGKVFMVCLQVSQQKDDDRSPTGR
jgi:hypothetical protein